MIFEPSPERRHQKDQYNRNVSAAGGPLPTEPLPLARRLLLFALPAFACFGPALPVLGSFFAFRAAVLLIFVTLAFHPQPPQLKTGIATTVRALSLVWLAAALTLLFFHGPSSYAWPELVSLFTGLILLYSISLTSNIRSVLEQLLKGWLVAYIATTLVAVREVYFGIPFYNYFRINTNAALLDGFGIASTFGNPNNYAFFLVVSLPILILGLYKSNKLLPRYAYSSSLITLPFLMFETGSRSGFALMLIVAAVYALFLFRATGLVLTFGGLLVFILSMPKMASDFFQSIVKPLSFLGGLNPNWLENLLTNDTSSQVRLNLIRNGINFSLESFLIGWGPGAFEHRMESGLGEYPTLGTLSPHNAILEILSQYGILVLGLFVVLLARLWWIGWRSIRDRRRSNSIRVESITLLSLVSIFPLLSTMNSSFIEPSGVWIYLALMSILGISLSQTPSDASTTSKLMSTSVNQRRDF